MHNKDSGILLQKKTSILSVSFVPLRQNHSKRQGCCFGGESLKNWHWPHGRSSVWCTSGRWSSPAPPSSPPPPWWGPEGKICLLAEGSDQNSAGNDVWKQLFGWVVMGGDRLLLWGVLEIRDNGLGKEQRKNHSLSTESWGGLGWKGHLNSSSSVDRDVLRASELWGSSAGSSQGWMNTWTLQWQTYPGTAAFLVEAGNQELSSNTWNPRVSEAGKALLHHGVPAGPHAHLVPSSQHWVPRPGVPWTPPGVGIPILLGQVQVLTTLPRKKFLLKCSLSLPWHSLGPFSLLLSLFFGIRAQPHAQLLPHLRP